MQISATIVNILFIFSSVVKTITHLHENLARIVKVRPAECKAVVQQHAPVAHVQSRHRKRNSLPKVLAERHVKRGVLLQVIARQRLIPVREARSVIHVGGSVASPRERPLPANVQRVPLVVVEQTETRRRNGAWTNQSSGDAAERERDLVRIGQVDLPSLANLRRPQRQLPAVDARALYCDGKKQVG